MTSLLTAVVHTVPVIVRSMPPVDIANWPPSDSLAWATFYASCGAVIVALITLGSVWWQSHIANQELDAVKKDFKFWQNQFDLAQKQFNELMRRPSLSVRVERYGEEEAFATLGDGSRPRIVHLRFNIQTTEGL